MDIIKNIFKNKINVLSLMNAKSTLLVTKDQIEYLLKILIGIPSNSSIQLAAEAIVQKIIL